MSSDKIRLSYTFSISDHGKISISDPESANSLKLIATIKQASSPFPDRSITLLTKYTVLDTTSPDAFVRGWLKLPYDVDDPNNKIRIYLKGWRPHWHRPCKHPDMRKREGFPFITVPPPGQGTAEVTWSMAPDHLLRFYKEDKDVRERLKRFKPGQTFRVDAPTNSLRCIFWWTFGSLTTDLKDKKFTPWSLPSDLPLLREPGLDEGDEIDSRLIDFVDLKDVRHLDSYKGRPDTNVPPKTKEWKADGWVFGEPKGGIDVSCESSAVFQFVE